MINRKVVASFLAFVMGVVLLCLIALVVQCADEAITNEFGVIDGGPEDSEEIYTPILPAANG